MPKHDEQPKYDSLPIPTYEEATSSRPSSSLSQQRYDNDDRNAERQRLLNGNATTSAATAHGSRLRGAYRAPTVESDRSSIDSDFTQPDVSDDDDAEAAELQRDMEQMEVVDPEAERRAQQRSQMRSRFTKSIATLTNRLSSFQFPRISFTSLNLLFARMPSFTQDPRLRPSWPIIARLIGLTLIAGLIYALFVIRVFTPGANFGQAYMPEPVRQFVLGSVDPSRIELYLREISSLDHVAGTKGDYFLAKYVEDHMNMARLDSVWNDDFEVFMTYPKTEGRRLAIVKPENLKWTARLEESEVPHGDRGKNGNDSPNKRQHAQTPAYHGYSHPGSAGGPLVFANYGSREDFDWLKSRGIGLDGAIVLMKYYGSQLDPSLKVKAAQDEGAAGCLIYSDPAEDGFVRGSVFPDGPWRTKDSVQRGSVAQTNLVVGDPLTPGWASTGSATRIIPGDSPALPKIPSLPLSWSDAQVLLQSLHGYGVQVPDEWVGGVPDIREWYTGDGSGSVMVDLQNDLEDIRRQPIRNVLGRIQGAENPDLELYVGNHRDAWCFGSVDPGSGTAVFLEVIRIFGELLDIGWAPRRTIVFASWDAAEYNLVGSTEHVEDQGDSLRYKGLAYLNVDAGVAGPDFRAAGPEIFRLPLMRALNRIADPTGNLTLAEKWDADGTKLEALDADGDYVAFQNIAGCSSLDFGFATKKPVGEKYWSPKQAYPYHSCYETEDWSLRFNDPDLSRHIMLTQIWTLLILELAAEPLLPLSVPDYAHSIQAAVNKLAFDAQNLKTKLPGLQRRDDADVSNLDLASLRLATVELTEAAGNFHKRAEEWENIVTANNMMETREVQAMRISHNERIAEFETNLLDLPQSRPPVRNGAENNAPFQARSNPKREDTTDMILHDTEHASKSAGDKRTGGLPGRDQYKHVVYAPPLDSLGYLDTSGTEFPGVRDALGDNNMDLAQEWVNITAQRISYAAWRLLH